MLRESVQWNYQGHMVVAGIAERLMSREEKDYVLKILSLYPQPCRNDVPYEDFAHPIVECSVYADQIKHRGGEFEQNWHFDDTPYKEDELPQTGFLERPRKTAKMSVTIAIEQLVDALKCAEIPLLGCKNNSPAYNQVLEYTERDDEQARGLAMRLLIHYIGDISQPLHTITRVTPRSPGGDKGGNLFNISSPVGFKDVTNLHSLWDTMIYADHTVMHTPFDNATWEAFETHIDQLLKDHGQFADDHPELTTYDPLYWSHHSFEIGKEAYEGVAEGEQVTNEYIEDQRLVAGREQVIGGYRLYKTINLLLTHSKDVKKLFLQIPLI